MNRAKLKFSFVFICIILSFFSINTCFGAYETPPDSVNMNGAYATFAGTNTWTFTCNHTGVYTIKNTKNDGESISDWAIQNSSGQYLRLACYEAQDSNTGENYYYVYSPISSSTDTSCKVILFEGQTYSVKTFENAEHTVNISLDKADNNKGYKQSIYNSYARTKTENGGYEGNLEPYNQEYEPVKTGDAEPVFKYTSAPSGSESFAKEFEHALVRLLLGVGDYLVKLLSDIVGGDLTISNLIFNKIDSVNPNFYDENNAGLAHVDVQDAITKWYTFFRGIAMLIYLIAILGIGIKVILNSTAKGIQEAKGLATEWLKGFLYLLLMPYGIYFLFRINEALVQELCEVSDSRNYVAGASFTDGVEWSEEEVEFRSPAYISRYTGIRGFGTKAANEYYLKNLKQYESNLDLMRIVRAYAGTTQLLSYTMIWYILIGQLLTFVYLYFKRYFMISFFIAIFPVMCMFQAIGIIKDGKSRAVSGWLGELISNIFTQTIHALIYVIITALIVDILAKSMEEASATNWVIIIVAINFVPQGEKILRRILKAISSGSSTEGVGEGGLKKGFNALKGGAKKIISG